MFEFELIKQCPLTNKKAEVIKEIEADSLRQAIMLAEKYLPYGLSYLGPGEWADDKKGVVYSLKKKKDE